MLTTKTDGVTPVVPAAHWVHGDISHLRVDYDDVVQFSDFIVASVSNERLSHIPSKHKTGSRQTVTLSEILHWCMNTLQKELHQSLSH